MKYIRKTMVEFLNMSLLLMIRVFEVFLVFVVLCFLRALMIKSNSFTPVLLQKILDRRSCIKSEPFFVIV